MSCKLNFLIVLAMNKEGDGLFDTEDEDVKVIYTGLGKVNAAYRFTRELARLAKDGQIPKAVFNFGTAGSSAFKTHELVECTRFVQRDMDLSALGFPRGTTPFENEPSVIEVPRRAHWLPIGICGTGDSFETGTPQIQCEVVDMEAYALAKICRTEQLPFICVKYITDGCDQNACKDWVDNLPRAATRFLDVFRRLKDLEFYHSLI